MSEYLGAVYFGGQWYRIVELLDSDSFDDGGRYLALNVELDPDYNDENGQPL